jgi:hypothetical protein
MGEGGEGSVAICRDLAYVIQYAPVSSISRGTPYTPPKVPRSLIPSLGTGDKSMSVSSGERTDLLLLQRRTLRFDQHIPLPYALQPSTLLE